MRQRPTERHPGAVSSPMVGTVYLDAGAGRAAVRQRRRQVTRGPDAADHRGDEDDEPDPGAARRHGSSTILVSDGQPVEFGEPLLIIE